MSALQLAEWILARAARDKQSVTHLKLQKLIFYSYGAALAHGVHHELGQIAFEAWKHGPVSREVYGQYVGFGANEIPQPASVPKFDQALTNVLEDVYAVYGRLSPWDLRNESHLERPWVIALAEKRTGFTHEELRVHFAKKFERGNVQLPVHLSGAANAAIDGIPPARFESLATIADTLRAMSQ